MNTAAQLVPLKQTGDGVVCVTVTYGDRSKLLRTVIDALPAQGVRKVVVVDNGAVWPVREQLAEAYGDYVDVIEMGRNTGSARGFGAGMRRAKEQGAVFIWVLDDDNCPAPNALPVLLDAYRNARSDSGSDLLGVTALRPVGQHDIPARGLTPRHSSYCGFHILDLPRKLAKRTFMRGLIAPRRLPPTIPVEVAAYSGMLFSAGLMDIIGLPDDDFVLYCDDYEWSHRIVQRGGRLLVVTNAHVIDLQRTWAGQLSNHPLSLLGGPGGSVAYYAMRNEVFFFGHQWRGSSIIYSINRLVFTGLLWLQAMAYGRMARYRLLRRAAADGEQALMGLNSEFPL
jgi:GT2 family glycosyltransferase